jgi:hypothetical protein
MPTLQLATSQNKRPSKLWKPISTSSRGDLLSIVVLKRILNSDPCLSLSAVPVGLDRDLPSYVALLSREEIEEIMDCEVPT